MTETPDESGFLSIGAALARVQAKLPRIHKDQTATVKSDKAQYSYSYADLTAVSAAVLPLLAENGLSFTAFPTRVEAGAFVLRYHLLHESGERLTGEYPLPSSGTPQAIGSAITYARRYCLCAVTGVAPDDDDDAAAAVAGQQAERSNDVQEALDAIRGAWHAQYGTFDKVAAAKTYTGWSRGDDLGRAVQRGDAGRLRAFAAYLSTLPASDAGSDPNEPAEPPAENGGTVTQETRPASMTRLQQGRLFATMTDYGITERQDQLDYMTSILGRTIKSRGELTKDDANKLIDDLERRKASDT